MMHGIVSQPSRFTARSRVCPSMTTLSLFSTAGLRKPNLSMTLASCSTAPSLTRGLFP